MSLLESIIIEPAQSATHSIIWLHGLGADGGDFAPFATELQFAKSNCTRFIFPHAPMQPVTINAGMTMRAWYDIRGFDLTSREDKEGIAKSCELVIDVIEAEHQKGIAYENITLGGFSQGGAIALSLLLTCPHKLAGVAALSTYLPLMSALENTRSDANQATSVFMAHGETDPVVQLLWGQASCNKLKEWQYDVDWKTYPMQHAVCPQEIFDISNWLNLVN